MCDWNFLVRVQKTTTSWAERCAKPNAKQTPSSKESVIWIRTVLPSPKQEWSYGQLINLHHVSSESRRQRLTMKIKQEKRIQQVHNWNEVLKNTLTVSFSLQHTQCLSGGFSQTSHRHSPQNLLREIYNQPTNPTSSNKKNPPTKQPKGRRITN